MEQKPEPEEMEQKPEPIVRRHVPLWKQGAITVCAIVLGFFISLALAKGCAGAIDWKPELKIHIEHSGYIDEQR